jgi:large subunit ribosomal protein L34
MPKRTYQPKKLRRLRRLGFRARNSSPSGRRILKRRMMKKRTRITVSDEFRVLKKKPKSRNR